MVCCCKEYKFKIIHLSAVGRGASDSYATYYKDSVPVSYIVPDKVFHNTISVYVYSAKDDSYIDTIHVTDSYQMFHISSYEHQPSDYSGNTENSRYNREIQDISFTLDYIEPSFVFKNWFYYTRRDNIYGTVITRCVGGSYDPLSLYTRLKDMLISKGYLHAKI